MEIIVAVNGPRLATQGQLNHRISGDPGLIHGSILVYPLDIAVAIYQERRSQGIGQLSGLFGRCGSGARDCGRRPSYASIAREGT